MSASRMNIGFVVFCAAVTGIGGFLFGYDTAVINGANSLLQKNFHLDIEGDAFLIGLATSSAIIGCIVGAMSAGFFSDRFGRRKVLFFCAVLYAVSGVLCAASWDFPSFMAARIVNGIAIGVSSMICPVYIAEIAPPQWRGRLGTLFQLGIVVGIFIALFSNSFIQSLGTAYWGPDWGTKTGWRLMLLLEALPAVFFLALLFPIPESPRWLIQAGREAEARRTLERIGGPAYAAEEVAAVNEVLTQEVGSFAELFSRSYRLPLVIAVFIMFAAQFSGINVIMYYSTEIFMRASKPVDTFNTSLDKAASAADLSMGREKIEAAIRAIQSPALQGALDGDRVGAVAVRLQQAQSATSLDDLRAAANDARRLVNEGGLGEQMGEISAAAGKTAFACSAWLGLVNVLATFIAILFVDKLGRKPLLLAGNLIQVAGLAGIGLLFWFSTDAVPVGALLGLVIVFIAAFAMAMGPIPWVLCSEIFPAKMRGRAMSVATFSIWMGDFVIVQTSPALMRHSPSAAFFFYGTCSLVTFFFVLFVIPETKGRSLEEIEKSWHRHPEPRRQEVAAV